MAKVGEGRVDHEVEGGARLVVLHVPAVELHVARGVTQARIAPGRVVDERGHRGRAGLPVLAAHIAANGPSLRGGGYRPKKERSTGTRLVSMQARHCAPGTARRMKSRASVIIFLVLVARQAPAVVVLEPRHKGEQLHLLAPEQLLGGFLALVRGKAAHVEEIEGTFDSEIDVPIIAELVEEGVVVLMSRVEHELEPCSFRSVSGPDAACPCKRRSPRRRGIAGGAWRCPRAPRPAPSFSCATVHGRVLGKRAGAKHRGAQSAQRDRLRVVRRDDLVFDGNAERLAGEVRDGVGDLDTSLADGYGLVFLIGVALDLGVRTGDAALGVRSCAPRARRMSVSTVNSISGFQPRFSGYFGQAREQVLPHSPPPSGN